jgi:hypothetical protein
LGTVNILSQNCLQPFEKLSSERHHFQMFHAHVHFGSPLAASNVAKLGAHQH